ncbi:MAG: glycine acetyltransferase, partial [Desulfovibrio sp.]|nr:glycine acetyltransferase [Desulfovibrio sp.]
TLEYIRHTSRQLIFSAALPAANAATALASLDILEKEPQRVERLWAVTRRARQGLARIGLDTGLSDTPIIPIILGDDLAAARFSKALFERGVFAPPAVFPAVPRGGALVRTAFMSTHTDAQVDRALEAIAQAAKKMGSAGRAAS